MNSVRPTAVFRHVVAKVYLGRPLSNTDVVNVVITATSKLSPPNARCSCDLVARRGNGEPDS